MKIAYVLYPDFTALDLVGPYEVISRRPEAGPLRAHTLDPVRCDCGLRVIPTAAARLARSRKALTQRRVKRGQPPPRVAA